MPAAEQRERMRLMRQQVREQNVYRWAGRMLVDAARIRQRRRIIDNLGTQLTDQAALAIRTTALPRSVQ